MPHAKWRETEKKGDTLEYPPWKSLTPYTDHQGIKFQVYSPSENELQGMISHIKHVTVMSLPKLKWKASYMQELVHMVYSSHPIAANVL